MKVINPNETKGIKINKKLLISIIIICTILHLIYLGPLIYNEIYNYSSIDSNTVMVIACISIIIILLLPLLSLFSGYSYARYKVNRDSGQFLIFIVTLVVVICCICLGAYTFFYKAAGLFSIILLLISMLICVVSSFILGVEFITDKNNSYIGALDGDKFSAFPGDTFVRDCMHSLHSTPKWLYLGFIAIAASVFVDLINLADLLGNTVLSSMDQTSAASALHLTPLSLITASAISLGYLVLGIYMGNTLRHFIFSDMDNKKYLKYETILGIATLIIFLVIVTLFRAIVEIDKYNSNQITYEPIPVILIYFSMMLIGAFVSLYYGYKKYDPLIELIAINAKNNIFEDRLLYIQEFENYNNKYFDEEFWESNIRKYDREILEATSRLAYISSEISMINDPSQAYDIAFMTQKINDALLNNEYNN